MSHLVAKFITAVDIIVTKFVFFTEPETVHAFFE